MSWLSNVWRGLHTPSPHKPDKIEMRVFKDEHPVSPVQFNNRCAKKLLPTHTLKNAIKSLDWETDDKARYAMMAGICDHFGAPHSLDAELALIQRRANQCVCDSYTLPEGETAQLWFSRQFGGADPIDRMIAIIKLYGAFPSLIPPEDLVFVNYNFRHCWYSLEEIFETTPDYSNIDLRAQKLYLLPANIIRFRNLRSLNAPSNCLIRLPIELLEIASLAHLCVPNNWLDEIPDEMMHPKYLQTLNISNNLIPPKQVKHFRDQLYDTGCCVSF